MVCMGQDTRKRRWQTGGVFGMEFSLGVNHLGVWVWDLPPNIILHTSLLLLKGFIIQPADAR